MIKISIFLGLLLAGSAIAQTNYVGSIVSSGTFTGNGSGLTNLGPQTNTIVRGLFNDKIISTTTQWEADDSSSNRFFYFDTTGSYIFDGTSASGVQRASVIKAGAITLAGTNGTTAFSVSKDGVSAAAGLLTTPFLGFTGALPTASTNGGTALGGSGASITVDANSTGARGSITLVTAATAGGATAKAGTVTFTAKPAADFTVIPFPLNAVTAGSVGAPHFFFTNYTTTTMEVWSCQTAPANATTYKVGWLGIQ